MADKPLISFDRDEYTHFMKKLYTDRDEIEAAEEKGLEKGLEKGRLEERSEGQAELIRRIIQKGHSVKSISTLTGLSGFEIIDLL